jgi:hypothetical protein
MDLKLGSSGPLVYVVQEQLSPMLVNFGIGLPFRATGIFDKSTEDGVKNLQRAIGLDATGIVDDLTSSCITRTTFDFESTRPPHIAQPQDKNHCWAAATSCWLAASARKEQKTQDLVDKLKVVQNALDESESITNAGWLHLKNLLGLNYIGFGSFAIPPAKKLSDLTPSLLLRLFQKKRHVMMAYNLDGVIAHTVVAFGLRVVFRDLDYKDNRTLLPDYQIKIMDPLRSGGLVRRPLNVFYAH